MVVIKSFSDDFVLVLYESEIQKFAASYLVYSAFVLIPKALGIEPQLITVCYKIIKV